jgi:hypothetical protein
MRLHRAAACSLAAVALIGLLPAGVATQTRSTAPRTAWGDADLQGVWANATITPLERPKALAGKEVLSDDEEVRLEADAVQSQVDRPPRPGDTGTYNQFWFDRGTKVVATRRTSLIVDPPDGSLPPYTKQGEEVGAWQRGFDAPEERSLWERCLTRGLPNVMIPGPYNNNYQIVQTPDYVVIYYEMIHDARIIPLDGRPHLDASMPQLHGDPRGRWEGDTLVVETTNFTDKMKGKLFPSGNYKGSGASMRLTERFTRIDADTIKWEFTVDEPATFTRPWTAVVPMYRGTADLYEYACHEGNYALPGILGGARAQEKMAQGAARQGSR